MTLDPDTEQLVRRLMEERGVSFKQALNDAIRAGAPARTRERFRTDVQSLGSARVNLDRALQIASDLDDEDQLRASR